MQNKKIYSIIKSLKNKYGDSIQKINEFLENAITEKEKLENFAQIFEDLIIEKSKLEKKIYLIYIVLLRVILC